MLLIEFTYQSFDSLLSITCHFEVGTECKEIKNVGTEDEDTNWEPCLPVDFIQFFKQLCQFSVQINLIQNWSVLDRLCTLRYST